MKIIQDSADRLYLRQGALGVLIVATLITLAGMALALFSPLFDGSGRAVLVIGIVTIVVGLVMFSSTKSVYVVAQKQARILQITINTVWPGASQPRQFAFDMVNRIDLISDYKTEYNAPNANDSAPRNGISFGSNGLRLGNSNTTTSVVSTLTVKFLSDPPITIATASQQAGTALGVQSNDLADVAQKLADAIGVPLVREGTAS